MVTPTGAPPPASDPQQSATFQPLRRLERVQIEYLLTRVTQRLLAKKHPNLALAF